MTTIDEGTQQFPKRKKQFQLKSDSKEDELVSIEAIIDEATPMESKVEGTNKVN